MSEEVPPQVTVRLDWADAATTSTEHVNQVLAQIGGPTGREGVPDGIYLTFGAVAPPIIPSDEEGRRLAIQELASGLLKVTVRSKLHMSREIVDELIRVLQTTAAMYDAAVEGASRSQPSEVAR